MDELQKLLLWRHKYGYKFIHEKTTNIKRRFI